MPLSVAPFIHEQLATGYYHLSIISLFQYEEILKQLLLYLFIVLLHYSKTRQSWHQSRRRECLDKNDVLILKNLIRPIHFALFRASRILRNIKLSGKEHICCFLLTFKKYIVRVDVIASSRQVKVYDDQCSCLSLNNHEHRNKGSQYARSQSLLCRDAAAVPTSGTRLSSATICICYPVKFPDTYQGYYSL